MSTLATHASRWRRDGLFHVAGLLTSIVAMVLWTTGVIVSLTLAITYVGLAATLWTLLAMRWLARVERRRAAIVLGAPIEERYRPLSDAPRWSARLHALIGERATWRDFAWTAGWGWIGCAFSTLAIGLWVAVLGLIAMPTWYWAVPGGAKLGILQVDSFALALASTAAGLALAPLCGLLVRATTRAELAMMNGVLRPRDDAADAEADATAVPAHEPAAPPLAPSFELHVALALLTGLVIAVIWAAAGGGYFWPVWVWFGLAITVGVHLIAVRAWHAHRDPVRSLRIKADAYALISAVCWVIWALSGGGYLWPFWPMLGMGTALALRALWVYRERLPWLREQALVERVDVLTRTRQGALNVQAAELRRIERDLHDGAQARLVALSMQLGRAEERLGDQPDIAALVRGAREDAGLAISELRDLARGIAPPILADRGLAAAIEALARRSTIDITIDADPDRRPLPVVETAAYFVVAEALTNVAKHAGGANAHVSVTLEDDVLVLEIADHGPGGADPGGGGLTGLRSRVEALDGRLVVTSPPGGGTTVRAELPCER
ncbi:MAG: sensor domain-containing protein [Solirubrobacteraceae bacterium]|nr:sensor domain-containing protein [Solirubrobacteraceae bacterium]